MPLLKHIVVKWVLGAVYIAVCLLLIFLFPVWMRPWLLGIYLIYLAWSYWMQEASVGAEFDLRALTPWDVPDYARFRAELERACLELELPREPYWAVMESQEANAMAVGGRRGMVIFTTTLLKALTPEQILAVAGHELQHLRSKDNLPGVIGGAWLRFVGAIAAFLFEVGGDSARAGISNFHGGGNSLLGALASLGAVILDMALRIVGWAGNVTIATRSRYQEHQADMAGAGITSVPVMCGALEKLEQAGRERFGGSEIHAKWSPAWIAQRLHASHPATPVRIQFLQQALERGEIRA